MSGERPKAVLYCRVSTQEQSEHGYSLRQQAERLREYAAGQGYEVLEEVEDPGYSGAYLERPGLDKVRDLVAAGGVSVVLAQDRDRFAREPAYLYLLREEFAARGTKLRALNDRGDESPEGQLTDGILDQLAKFERAKTSERSRRGLDRKVLEGKIIRGNSKPYGLEYTEDGETLLVSEPEMGVLRRIMRMVGIEGDSLGEVRRALLAEGVPSAHGGGWPRSTIRYLILNELYLPRRPAELEGLVPEAVLATLDPEGVYGLWTWNKSRATRRTERGEDGTYRNRVSIRHRPREEWMGVPVDLSESGLQRAVVEAARERVHERARKAADRRGSHPSSARRLWLLSGGVARCALCGNAMSPHTVHQHGTIREYYRCYTRYNCGLDHCTNGRSNRAAPLEDEVWHAIRCLLVQPERLVEQYSKYIQSRRERLRGDPDAETRALAERLGKLEEERRNYIRQNARGAISDTDLDAMLAEVDAGREGVRKALSEARDRQEQLQSLDAEQEEVFSQFYWLRNSAIRTASPETRRKVLKALRITVTVDQDGNAGIKGIFGDATDLAGLLPPDAVESGEATEDGALREDQADIPLYKGDVTLYSPDPSIL